MSATPLMKKEIKKASETNLKPCYFYEKYFESYFAADSASDIFKSFLKRFSIIFIY